MMNLPNPRQNALLAALDDAGCMSLMTHLEPVELERGQVLCDAGCEFRYVYFPTTAIVSLACLTENGEGTEVAAVGNEGFVGVSVLMGGQSTTCTAEVQCAGTGYRIRAHTLQQAFNNGGPMMQILLRYTQTLMTLMTQTAACNRHHSVARQLSRWLLHTLDRLPGNDMSVTHQVIARALGVRREGVTEAAMNLQRGGYIRYTRGLITVLDRDGLEQQACECYAMVARECDRLRPSSMSAGHGASASANRGHAGRGANTPVPSRINAQQRM